MLCDVLPKPVNLLLMATGVFGGLVFSQSLNAQATPDAWLAVTDDLHIGQPLSHEGLQVFPIHSQTDTRSKSEVLSLKEALNLGAITIHEHGEGSVPELTVVNQGKKTVLLAVGDVVQGGKQDRVIISDVLIPPTPNPVTVQVNCVEAGRWSTGAHGVPFQYGGRGESALKKVLEIDKDQNATWQKVAELNLKKASRIDRVAMANVPTQPNDAYRRPTQQPQSDSTILQQIQVLGQGHGIGGLVIDGLGTGGQGTGGLGIGGGATGSAGVELQSHTDSSNDRRTRIVEIDFDDHTGLIPPVESEIYLLGPNEIEPPSVNETVATQPSELVPPTGTYMASLGASPVSENVEPYMQALGPLLEESQTIGFVAALDGKILGAELYGNARLFKSSKKDILRALSLDALSRPTQKEEDTTALSVEEVAGFLRTSLAGMEEGITSSHGSKGRIAAEKGTTFITYDDNGDLLHTNVYAH